MDSSSQDEINSIPQTILTNQPSKHNPNQYHTENPTPREQKSLWVVGLLYTSVFIVWAIYCLNTLYFLVSHVLSIRFAFVPIGVIVVFTLANISTLVLIFLKKKIATRVAFVTIWIYLIIGMPSIAGKFAHWIQDKSQSYTSLNDSTIGMIVPATPLSSIAIQATVHFTIFATLFLFTKKSKKLRLLLIK